MKNSKEVQGHNNLECEFVEYTKYIENLHIERQIKNSRQQYWIKSLEYLVEYNTKIFLYKIVE